MAHYFNHILTAEGSDYVPKHYARCDAVTTKPISDCNWDSETGRPAYCGNCRDCVTDAESQIDYCLMSEINEKGCETE